MFPVKIHSCPLYLFVASDFNECTSGVEGPCPTGIDMCSVVIVKDPDKICTFQLEQAGTEKEHVWGTLEGLIEQVHLVITET